MTYPNIPNDAADLTFGTPVIGKRGPKSVWPRRAEKMAELLVTRPGEWAVFRSGLTASYASKTCTRYRATYQNLEWVSTKAEDGTYSIWARVPAND